MKCVCGEGEGLTLISWEVLASRAHAVSGIVCWSEAPPSLAEQVPLPEDHCRNGSKPVTWSAQVPAICGILLPVGADCCEHRTWGLCNFPQPPPSHGAGSESNVT
jgi:hypothetical protein